ncbi:MAG: type II secretion system protein M [Oscillospiraceae bacterium]|nr:type II secretion system protein M [Oscillospiraceae bacterium]
MVAERKGFSTREKIMMFILIVVAIFAIMVIYVIIPLFNQLEEKRTELGRAQSEKARVDAILATENTIREGRDEAVARHGLESARFLDESHASEVGRMLTQLCQRSGLEPVDLSLTDPVDFSIPNDEEGAPANEDSKTVFLITSASMTVTGDYTSFKKLLDEVEKTDYLRISQISYVFGVASDDSVVMDRIAIGFEVTMLKDDIDERRQLAQPDQDDLLDLLDLEAN